MHARLGAYVVSHLRAFFFSLGKLYRAPLSSLMTTAVIGVALALPTGLHLLLANLEHATAGWSEGNKISLFLKTSVSSKRGEALAGELRKREDIATVQHLDREQALAEFKGLSGFASAIEALDENPLPGVLIVQPTPARASPGAIEAFVAELSKIGEVDFAQLDTEWVQRLNAITELARQGVLVFGGMLGLAVLLVVGNTIRLDIQNRRQEIEVAKLIGATDAFIRRPFLYGGAWYGLLGALLGLILVQAALGLMAGPARRLAGLYGSDFRLLDLDPGAAGAVLLLGLGLGLAGSWLAVGRHLSDIEPR
jgi:cell division transport system permease protein